MPEQSGYELLDEILNDIADALRVKLSNNDPINAQDFSTLILDIGHTYSSENFTSYLRSIGIDSEVITDAELTYFYDLCDTRFGSGGWHGCFSWVSSGNSQKICIGAYPKNYHMTWSGIEEKVTVGGREVTGAWLKDGGYNSYENIFVDAYYPRRGRPDFYDNQFPCIFQPTYYVGGTEIEVKDNTTRS